MDEREPDDDKPASTTTLQTVLMYHNPQTSDANARRAWRKSIDIEGP